MRYVPRNYCLPILLASLSFLFLRLDVSAQGCCAGGSGSPIAGGASQGVLNEKQMELSTSFQYMYSNKFRSGDVYSEKYFDQFNSKYSYNRIGYGFAKNFTFSIEAGYFFNKTQIGLNQSDTIQSSGFADLILFPRFNVLTKSNDSVQWDITIGLGYKIPLGKHNDSTLVFTNPSTGQRYFTTSPPLVQPTTGANDVIFYGFFLRGFPRHQFQIFAMPMYILKGWNSLGQRFGDYASLGLFATKSIGKGLVFGLQLRGDMVKPITHDPNFDLLALYNIDVNSTGSRKLAMLPQLIYTKGAVTLFAMNEFPLYEYVRGDQVASKITFTTGLAYRFNVSKTDNCEVPNSNHAYYCPMNCEGSGSDVPGSCSVCGMDLLKK